MIASFNWIDVVIVLILVVSTIISFIRGFTREALSLIAWVVAIWVALTYCHDLADKLPSSISQDQLRVVIAFAAIFIVVLLLGALISYLVSHLVEKTRLTLMNRLLGILFGAARGVLLVAIAILAAQLSPIPQYGPWKQSVLIPEFKPVTNWIQSFLPDYVNKHFPQQAKTVQDGINSTTQAVTPD